MCVILEICIFIPSVQIWEDILGFENAEFYIKRWPQLDGLQFKDVMISFPDAVPCGVKVAANGGKILLNPDDDYVLKEGDEILVIAEDDDTYEPGPLPEVNFPSLHVLQLYKCCLLDTLYCHLGKMEKYMFSIIIFII